MKPMRTTRTTNTAIENLLLWLITLENENPKTYTVCPFGGFSHKVTTIWLCFA